MNTERQTTQLLSNADNAIYDAYIDLGIKEGSDQRIHWYLGSPNELTTDTIVDQLNKILPEMGGFDDFIIDVIPSERKGWTISVQTFCFTLDHKTLMEFSETLFGICNQHSAEYMFWNIAI